MTFRGHRIGALVTLSVLLVSSMVPGLFWIILDKSVWSWDPAHYGYMAVRIAQAWNDGLQVWWQAMSAPSAQAPLLYWTAQIFAPFGGVFSRTETALLLTNTLFGGVALLWLYQVVKKWTGSLEGAVVAVLLCGGSAAFFGLSQQFFTEMSQVAAVCLLMSVAYGAGHRRMIDIIPRAIFAITFAMLAKLSSMFFIFPLAAYGVVAFAVTDRADRLAGRPLGTIVFAVLSLILVPLAALWYRENLQYVIQHAATFSVSELADLYGSRSDVAAKLNTWFHLLSISISPYKYLVWAIFLIILSALIFDISKVLEKGSAIGGFIAAKNSGFLFALCLIGTLCLVLLTYSLQVNEEMRFAAPLVPVVAALTGWAVTRFKTSLVSWAAMIALLLDAVVLMDQTFGGMPRDPRLVWYVQEPVRSPEATERIKTAVAISCVKETSADVIALGVGIPEFNDNALTFEAWKDADARGFGCSYRATDPYEKDFVAQKAKIESSPGSLFVTLPTDQIPSSDSPHFYANQTGRAVAEWIAQSASFERISPDGSSVMVYERVR